MDHKAALDHLRRFVVAQRRTLHITQATLASNSGVSKPTISRLEQGTLDRLPKMTTLEKLACGLEVRFEDLESLVFRAKGAANQAKARVLIVEDEESLSRLWTMSLNRAGYATVSAANGEDALALFNYAEPDAVLLDLMMPGITGLDLLRYLRRDLGFKGAVIVVTARHEEIEGEYKAAGADEVLMKGAASFGNQSFVEALECQLKKVAVGV